MEDVRHPRFTGAPAVIVARGMSELVNEGFAGMEPLLGIQRIRDLKRRALADRGRYSTLRSTVLGDLFDSTA
jgi:hypothetical protein